MSDFLTVIVPVYKIKEEYLRACIDSLVNQERDGYKIILVDDGSPDNCGEICDEYADRYEYIEVIHQPNQGVSVARNIGIERTTTEWLSFIDADDWVEPTYIEELFQAVHTKASTADVIMFDYVREYKTERSYESLNLAEGFLKEQELQMCKKATFYKLLQDGKSNPYTVIGLMTKIYNTDFLKKGKFRFVPEARKGQDRLFNADVLNSTNMIYYTPKVLFHYRCWEESRTHRYDPNVPNLTHIELECLANILIKHNLTREAHDYYTCRVCTRLYPIMRLYYFNPQNPAGSKQQIHEIAELVKSEPYKSSLKTVKMSLLSTQEKIFIMCIKVRMYRVCRLLVQMKSRRFAKKLS